MCNTKAVTVNRRQDLCLPFQLGLGQVEWLEDEVGDTPRQPSATVQQNGLAIDTETR